jgi:hypothetical protein
MRIRIGFFLGLAIGYYFGAKAGRERYEQMRRLIGYARDNVPVEKAQAAVQLGVQRLLHEPATPAPPSVPTRVTPN